MIDRVPVPCFPSFPPLFLSFPPLIKLGKEKKKKTETERPPPVHPSPPFPPLSLFFPYRLDLPLRSPRIADDQCLVFFSFFFFFFFPPFPPNSAPLLVEKSRRHAFRQGNRYRLFALPSSPFPSPPFSFFPPDKEGVRDETS